jgi:hypothetical protein
VQVMKLLIMQFSHASSYLISVGSKCSSHYPVLKHSQSVFFAHCQKPSIITIQKTGNLLFCIFFLIPNGIYYCRIMFNFWLNQFCWDLNSKLNKILNGDNIILRFHVMCVPVTTAWRVLGLRTEERPPAMEGSCEYIE